LIKHIYKYVSLGSVFTLLVRKEGMKMNEFEENVYREIKNELSNKMMISIRNFDILLT